jgi:hypothetical protein
MIDSSPGSDDHNPGRFSALGDNRSRPAGRSVLVVGPVSVNIGRWTTVVAYKEAVVSILGTRVTRVEDPDLLTVGGMYVDDLAPADAVHAVFVRSEMAHAEILGIDVTEAMAADGVVAVFTAADLGLTANPPSMGMLNQQMLRTWLSRARCTVALHRVSPRH